MNARERREEGLRLGFDAVGVARAERLDRDATVLQAWLGRDYHATMAWMARAPHQLSDPEALLPGCKSVIVAAMSYWPGAAQAATPAGRARVALYARGSASSPARSTSRETSMSASTSRPRGHDQGAAGGEGRPEAP